jgi:signal transduction histidine kinase
MNPRTSFKRLRGISWLMLVSELLLLLFVAEWIRNQYNEEKARLKADVQRVFDATKDEMLSSWLRKQIKFIVSDDETGDTVQSMLVDTAVFVPGVSSRPIRVQSQFLLDTPTLVPELEEIGKSIKATMTVSRTNTPLDPSALGEVKIVRSNGGPGPSLDQLTKMVKIIIATATDSTTPHSMPDFIADSSAFRSKFELRLKAAHLPDVTQWQSTDTGKEFVFRDREIAGNTALQVQGYGWVLGKQLLPQVLFSGTLVLLTALAFLLSYRNMRRQMVFAAQKDDFISNISHELKTPVATTKVALEALSNFNALNDPARSAQYLQMANWEMDRLESMIQRVMDTMQTEQDALAMNMEVLALQEVVSEITSTLQPVLDSKNIMLHWNIKEKGLKVLADKIHLRGLLYNLLDNAIKYGRSLIEIGIARDGDNAIVRIADNGEGIAPGYRHKVFEKFFRIPSGNQHNIKGHGLGLAYAQAVAKAHGALLRLEPEQGRGAVFTLILPAV